MDIDIDINDDYNRLSRAKHNIDSILQNGTEDNFRDLVMNEKVVLGESDKVVGRFSLMNFASMEELEEYGDDIEVFLAGNNLS